MVRGLGEGRRVWIFRRGRGREGVCFIISHVAYIYNDSRFNTLTNDCLGLRVIYVVNTVRSDETPSNQLNWSHEISLAQENPSCMLTVPRAG